MLEDIPPNDLRSDRPANHGRRYDADDSGKKAEPDHATFAFDEIALWPRPVQQEGDKPPFEYVHQCQGKDQSGPKPSAVALVLAHEDRSTAPRHGGRGARSGTGP